MLPGSIAAGKRKGPRRALALHCVVVEAFSKLFDAFGSGALERLEHRVCAVVVAVFDLGLEHRDDVAHLVQF